MVATFLRKGGTLFSTTTMSSVMLWNGGTQSASGTTTVKQHAPIQLSPADFPSFTGEIEEQESYKTKGEAQIRQTAFKFLLTRDAANQEEKERDKELFNVFKNSLHGGKAYNVITHSLKDDQGNTLPLSGWKAWQDFEKCCNSGGRKHTLIKTTKRELDALKLDRVKVDGFDYINKHLLLYTELDCLGAKATDIKQLNKFVENIVDSDFET
eukprot:10595039-Ditylum_brightwellii.AAC.1